MEQKFWGTKLHFASTCLGFMAGILLISDIGKYIEPLLVTVFFISIVMGVIGMAIGFRETHSSLKELDSMKKDIFTSIKGGLVSLKNDIKDMNKK